MEFLAELSNLERGGYFTFRNNFHGLLLGRSGRRYLWRGRVFSILNDRSLLSAELVGRRNTCRSPSPAELRAKQFMVNEA